MDDNRLRAIILRLQDRLSEADRKRLHFFLAKDVPRRITDDQTYDGTFRLIQYLFDQEKISEENFTYLIDVFEEIRYTEGVKLLKEYKEQIQFKCLTQYQTSSASIPLNKEIIEDQEEDKSATQVLIRREETSAQTNQIIGSKNTSINGLTINVENNPVISPRSDKDQSFYIALRMNRCLLFISLLLILITFTLVFILIINFNQTNPSGRQIPEKILLESKAKHNRSEREWDQILREKNSQITNLNNQILQLKEGDPLIKPGEKFGIAGDGTYFDDSKLEDFTCSHYLYRITVRKNNQDGYETYRFRYISSSNVDDISSSFHGNEDIPERDDYPFETDDRIVRVQGEIVEKRYPSINGTILTKSIITKLHFTSEQRLSNPLDGEPSELNFSESFEGYYLGYIAGQETKDHINQIQFHWYRK